VIRYTFHTAWYSCSYTFEWWLIPVWIAVSLVLVLAGAFMARRG
jgi:hypothetical protein